MKKAFFIARNILLSRLFKIKAPLIVTMELTKSCNLRCKFCPVQKKSTLLKLDKIKKMMDDFKKAGVISIGFTGGEPLLRKDIAEIFSYAKQKGFQITLITNGTLIKSKIRALKELDLIGISIDGPKEINDKIRGKGCFDKAIEAAKAVVKSGKKCYLNMTLNSSNLDYVGEMILLSKKLGAYLNIQPIYVSVSKKGPVNDAKIDRQKYSSAINTLISYKKKKYPILCSLSYLRTLKRYPGINKVKCYGGLLFLFVTAEGILKSCYFDPNGVKFSGNLKNDLKKLKPFNCALGCYVNCYLEYNLLLSLNASSILNAANIVGETALK